MTFDQYMDAVSDYYRKQGATWGEAYMEVLKKEKPNLAEMVVHRNHLNPAKRVGNLGDFLNYIRQLWKVYS